MLRIAIESDIPQLVEIHTDVLPGDLLPRLGRRFLETCFFPAVLASPHGFIVVDDEADALAGFCIFSYDTRSLTRDATARKFRLLSALLMRAIRDPSIICEIVALFRRQVELPDGRKNILESGVPEIYLMGVRPSQQGRGLGGQLISYGLDRLTRRYGSCLVRTDKEDARRFYCRNGFVQIGLERRGRRRFLLLVREWNDS